MVKKTFVLLFIFVTLVFVKVISQSPAIDPNQLERITPENIETIEQIGRIGNGGTGLPVWSGDGAVLGVMNPLGFWLHNPNDLSENPILIAETDFPSQALLNYDGSRLIIWNENSIEYWDTETKTCFEPCPLPSYEFNDFRQVLLSVDGSRMVVVTDWGASWDYERERVVLYDLINQTKLYETEFVLGATQLEFSSDDLSLIVGDWGQTQVVSLETGEIELDYKWGYEGIYPSFLGLKPHNTQEGFSMDSLNIVDIPSWESLRQFTAPVANEELYGFSLRHENYLVAHYTDTLDESHLLVWDWNTTELLGNYLVSYPSEYSIQDDWLFVQENGGLRVYALGTGTLELSIENVSHVSLEPFSQRLAITDESRLRLWDLATAIEIDSSGAFYFSSGELLAVRENIIVSQAENKLFIWDALTTELVATWTTDIPVLRWQFSSDGDYLLGLGYSEIIFLNIRTGETRILETLEGDAINDFVLTGDGQYLITATGYIRYCPDTGTPYPCPLSENSVRVWNAETGEQISLIERDESEYGIYTSVALSPDEHWLAISKSNELKILDFSEFPNTPLPIRSTIDPEDAVIDIAFSPDGSEIALGYGLLYSNDGFATNRLFSATVWLMEEILIRPETDEQAIRPYNAFLSGEVSEIHYDSRGDFLFLNGIVWAVSSTSSDFRFGSDILFDNRLLLVSTGNGTIEFWAIPMNGQ
jgi:WD40 repeat protein